MGPAYDGKGVPLLGVLGISLELSRNSSDH